MKRLLVSSAVALSCFSAQATELEISLYYSDAFYNDSGVLLSSDIVGFYRSIDAANALFDEAGANLTFVPAKISGEDVSVFPNGKTTRQTRGLLDYGTMEVVSDSASHFAVGLGYSQGGVLGVAVPYYDYGYATPSINTKKSAVASGVMSRTDSRYPYILAHEVLHSFGGSHDESGAQSFDSLGNGEDYGHGDICDDGEYSLMHELASTGASAPLVSGQGGCNSGHGDMVRFINTYAPLVANDAVPLNMNTLKMVAIEDTAESEFEFTVTRSINTSQPSTVELHISGSGATITNEIIPVEIDFLANELSKTVRVPFSSIHPLFEEAKFIDGQVYAVAISDDEVMKELLDVTALNTAWTDTPDPIEPDDGGGDVTSTGGSGGGSMSWFGLITLLMLRKLRRL
ncbi:hypothetical protein [Vibrio mediterranei]|uniref:GlyGly-CTERM sorting domain-containing protein n=1 Tax=Vibrio mediterranei TaxID=689 RepID=A0A3G4V6W2_9VIBR|nr:hypothetical protein [Vibrio mediterranei]AYV20526.1 hypothetical protein ECB94_04055 [Vibrio mediterranei]